MEFTKENIIKYEEVKLTQDLIFLDKDINDNRQYVLFGDWPQSLKKDDVEINREYKYLLNGWECYKGNDGAFYVKEYGNPRNDESCFSDGSEIEKGKEYFYKIESIKWEVLDTNYKNKDCILLHCVNALEESIYFTSKRKRFINFKLVYPSNYKYSYIRAYLNGYDGRKYKVGDHRDKGFIHKAFTKDAIEKIQTTTVDNSVNTFFAKGEEKVVVDKKLSSVDTHDKVFLLSQDEVTKSEYGFDLYDRYINDNKGTKTSRRKRIICDYARASNFWFDNKEGRACWWLRTPNQDTGEYARYVCDVGDSRFSNLVDRGRCCGIVPAIVVKNNQR